jgi:hypothetical protein
MEDDDLADQAQRMLDALDTFLANKKLVGQLSASDLQSFKEHRHDVFAKLAAYRAINFFTRRRPHSPVVVVPSGPHQGLPVPIAIGGIVVAAQPSAVGGAAATTFGGWEAAAVLGEVLLPIAAAAILAGVTGGTLSNVFGRHLVDTLTALARDLVELDVASTILAITAAEAAVLSLHDLWTKLMQAAVAGSIGALTILTAELIRRFPACVGVITAFRDAVKSVQRLRGNKTFSTGTAGQRKLFNALKAQSEAALAMRKCISGS